jgi:hypothetical protein
MLVLSDDFQRSQAAGRVKQVSSEKRQGAGG